MTAIENPIIYCSTNKLQRLSDNKVINKPKVLKTGCWKWTGTVSNWGYPYIDLIDGTRVYIHRLALWLRLQDPKWLPWKKSRVQVHHKCQNKWCVNPFHLTRMSKKRHYERHRKGFKPIGGPIVANVAGIYDKKWALEMEIIDKKCRLNTQKSKSDLIKPYMSGRRKSPRSPRKVSEAG